MMRHAFKMRNAAACMVCALAGVTSVQAQPGTIKFEYDGRDNVTKVTDGLNHSTTYTYDRLSRRKMATDANFASTLYDYDGLDRLTKVTDARGAVTSYAIDGLGNLLRTTSADTGSTINLYDEAGNLTSATDARQQTTTYRYDALDRPVLVTFADGDTVVYQYDLGANALGRLSRVVDSSGSIDFTYDQHGRVTSETRMIGGATFVTSYRFDAAGQLSGLTYPSGRRIDYERDAMGRISQVSATAGGTVTMIVSQVKYEPFGPIREITYGNGRTQVRQHDLDGRLSGFSLASQEMAISYDAANRITAIADVANAASGSTYGYDAADRLNSVVATGNAQTYLYDGVGNRTQKNNNGAVTAYTYAAGSNRLMQTGPQAITTDANGSITNKGNAGFNFDARGRMVSANTSIGLVQYAINSLGQRVRKVTPASTTLFHYDRSGQLIGEATTAGSTTTTQDYIYLDGMPVAVMK